MKKYRIGATDIALLVISILFFVGTLLWFGPCDHVKDDGSFMNCHWAGVILTGLARHRVGLLWQHHKHRVCACRNVASFAKHITSPFYNYGYLFRKTNDADVPLSTAFYIMP